MSTVKAKSKPPVVASDLALSLEAAIDRAMCRAPVDLRALLIASFGGGGEVAPWRLALRILPELDAAGWRFEEGWTSARRPGIGDLDDVIAAGLTSGGWQTLADAAAGELSGVRSLSRAVAAHFESLGIRPHLALKTAE